MAPRLHVPRLTQSRPILSLVLGCILIAGAVTISTVLVLSHLRDRAIADSARELQNTALVLAEQTDRAFQAIELVEISVVERVQSLGITTSEEYNLRMSERDVHLMLKDKISTLPHIDAVSMVSSEGKLISFSRSWPAPPNDLSDRDYFNRLKSDPQLTSFVSEPVLNRGSGTWAIFLVRKVTGRNGEFLGVIVGTMQLQRFEDLYESIALGEDSSISLFRRDGVLLARHPHVAPSIGQSYASSNLFRTVLAHSDHGISRQTSPIDQKERLIAAASLAHYPVIVTSTRAVPAVLADWRSEARYLAGLTVVLVVAIGGMGAAMVRRFHEQSIRLDTALNNMGHGLSMFDSRQRLVVANRRYVELYRLPPEQVKRGSTLRRLTELRAEAGTCPGDPGEHSDRVLTDLTEDGFRLTIAREIPDGRTISVTSAPMANGGWVATHEDITERKRAQNEILERKIELEQLNTQFDIALNNMTHGLCMYDGNMRLIVCNARYAEMYGLPQELTKPGTTYREILQNSLRRATADEGVAEMVRRKGTVGSFLLPLVDGRIIAVSHRPLADGGWVSVHDDVTERKRAEHETLERKAELERLNAQFDAALTNMTHGLCMFDGDMRLIVCNARYAAMYGVPQEFTKPGTTYRQMVSGTPSRQASADDLVATMERCKGLERSFLRDLIDGRIFAVSHRPIADGGWLGIHEDVTERRRAEAQIEHMARHDPLTGLPNRAAFTETLAVFLERAKHENGRFALLCIDIDRFKEVNDVFGHPVGDGLLCEIARRLEAAAAGAFLARLGGDEFVILSAQEPQPAATEALAERIQAALAHDIVIEQQPLRIGVSLGVAIFPGDGEQAASILANADAALYRAKADGRGSIRFFDATMDQRLRDCRALQHDLRSAADRGEIVVHYQPQARMDGSTVGFEALVRWQHPVRGMIAPGAFISVAEESGLIIPLGEWILREACREAASWPKPLTIGVNLSPVQFRHGDLVATVHAILLETGLPPDRLELEITEGVLIGDFSRALSILRRLKNLGVRIAMDDFGTGYSSLSYLQTFPFDKIKIDRSFVSNVQTNQQSAAIIRAVIGLGRGLNLPIIAEGVETQGELDFLAGEACDEVQGYFVGRPAPIAKYAKLVGREPIADKQFAIAE
jgi:diguanylate cyclase (GGDEF)-like protein